MALLKRAVLKWLAEMGANALADESKSMHDRTSFMVRLLLKIDEVRDTWVYPCCNYGLKKEAICSMYVLAPRITNLQQASDVFLWMVVTL